PTDERGIRIDPVSTAVRIPTHMSEPTRPGASARFVPWVIFGLVGVYGLSLVAGWPQYGTEVIVGQLAHDSVAHNAEPSTVEAQDLVTVEAPPLWTVLPFVALLGAIAILPLLPAAHHWWESNRNKLMV